MHRWGDLDDRQFPAPHLRWGHCALQTQWGNVLQEGVNVESKRQTKPLFVLRCFSEFFLAVYLFNFLHGRRGLPYLRLFIPANRLVAFCLQVTHPEVTFNSWAKKCVVMLGGTDFWPEEVTNTVKSTEVHSWPMVRVSLETRSEGGGPALTAAPIWIVYDH